MARWLIFAAWKPDDPALWNSHWIAAQTARIADDPTIHIIERENATRSQLEAALTAPDIRGLALFGHGRPYAVMGTDGKGALDTSNIALVARRWAHALACNTGQELVQAATGHAEIFVGYDVGLIVEWTIEELPEELRERIAKMVTTTTMALADGERSKRELEKRAAMAADEVTDWLLTNTDDGYLGLHILAQQLVDRMVVSG